MIEEGIPMYQMKANLIPYVTASSSRELSVRRQV
jgi:hypothetical protein